MDFVQRFRWVGSVVGSSAGQVPFLLRIENCRLNLFENCPTIVTLGRNQGDSPLPNLVENPQETVVTG